MPKDRVADNVLLSATHLLYRAVAGWVEATKTDHDKRMGNEKYCDAG